MFSTGILLRYRKKRYMDEPDWLLELVAVPTPTNSFARYDRGNVYMSCM
jgi:hypothetical protein